MYTLGRLWTPIPFSAPMRISMISFLKSHSYLIFRCIAIQLGMTMFGLVLSMATVNNEALQLVVGIFSVLFYLYLLIDAAFSVGLKEQPKVAAGRAKAEPYTGLLVSLCANALNIALAIAIWVGFFVTLGTGVTQTWSQACILIAAFVQGMYSGVIGFLTGYVGDASGIWNTLIYTLILIPAPVVCSIGYYCGTRGIYIVPGYRGTPKDEN